MYYNLIFQWQRLTSIFSTKQWWLILGNNGTYTFEMALFHWRTYIVMFGNLLLHIWWSQMILMMIRNDKFKKKRAIRVPAYSIIFSWTINTLQGNMYMNAGSLALMLLFDTRSLRYQNYFHIFYWSFLANWLLLLLILNVFGSFVCNGLFDKTNGWLLNWNKFLWFLNFIIDRGR